QFCGESVKASVRVVPSLLTRNWRIYLPQTTYVGQTINWDANGANQFYLDAPDLGLNDYFTTATSYAFTAQQLNASGPGVHTIKLKSCKLYSDSTRDCAADYEVRAQQAGTVTGLRTPPSTVAPSDAFFPTAVAFVDGVKQTAGAGGTPATSCDCNNEPVTAGTVLATIDTNNYSLMQIVRDNTEAWTFEPWTNDFSTGEYIRANQLADVRPGGTYFTVN